RPRVERPRVAAAHDREVVVGAEEPFEPAVLARAREREPLLPRDALLALDHEADAHAASLRVPPRARLRAAAWAGSPRRPGRSPSASARRTTARSPGASATGTRRRAVASGRLAARRS